MRPRLLSDGDRQILAELGRYRLLTIDQVRRLQLPGAIDRKHIGDRLAYFAKIGIVDRTRASTFAPFVHWLTPKAASHYGDEFGEAWSRAASGKGFSPHLHMLQRSEIIDVCIAARLWLQRSHGTIDELRLEFHAAAEKLAKATALEAEGRRYIPDALCEFTEGTGAPRTFALEVETGGFQRRLDNFAKRLPDRLEVMQHHVIDKALNRPEGKAARLLFVFSTAEMLHSALKIAGRHEPASSAWRRVYFQALPAALTDFGGEWITVTGERRSPFLKSPA